GRGLDALPERRSPAGEIVGVGGEHLEDIELEQLKRTPLWGPAEMPQQGTRRNLQETSHLDEWLDLGEIPNHVLVALRVRNQRPDVVLQQPLDELIRTGSNLSVRKLEQDDPVAVQFAEERHFIAAQQRDDVGRQPYFGRHADMQRYARLAQRQAEVLERLLDGAARVFVAARVNVRRHHGVRNAIGHRGLRQGEPVGERLRTVIDARQKMTVQVDHVRDRPLESRRLRLRSLRLVAAVVVISVFFGLAIIKLGQHDAHYRRIDPFEQAKAFPDLRHCGRVRLYDIEHTVRALGQHGRIAHWQYGRAVDDDARKAVGQHLERTGHAGRRQDVQRIRRDESR